MKTFDLYARYYDLIYRDKDYAGEAKYLAGLLKQYAPLANSILELGCGTGRHAAELAALDYQVQGVDLSEEMVERAERHFSTLSKPLQAKLSCRQGDLRTVRLHKHFDAVISLFHVMSYQSTNQDLLASFGTARAHLEAGGFFVFDGWYGPGVLSDPPVLRARRWEDKEVSVLRVAEPVMHANENTVDVNYRIVVMDRVTKQFQEISETHCMRYFFKPELEMILSEAKLQMIFFSTWLTNQPPSLHTWNIVCVARAV